jgi:cytochrome P450
MLHHPPAPKPLDKPLGTIPLLFAMRRNPLGTWTRAHYEEPILHGESIIGEVCVVNDPAGIRHVLVDNAANYRKDDLQQRLLGPGLAGGLLLAEDDMWRRQRRLLAPLFTPRAVAGYKPAMAQSGQWLVDRWMRQRSHRVIDVASEFSRVTLDVLERTIFPQGLGSDPSRFIHAVTDYFETAGRVDPLDLLRLPEWLPRLGRARAKPALEFFAEAVQAMIDKRRAALASGAASDQPDLLSALLSAADPETGVGLTEEEVRANILTFIGAGHETTANALTWTSYLLSTHPHWRARAEEEADALLNEAGHIPSPEDAPILRAVLEESMRLYPPAATLTRDAVAADVICGQRIRAGTRIVVSPWLVQRHKKLWTDADLFNPARFLPDARDRIDRFAFLPFGAGPRICIGMGFAMQEAVILLAHVLKNFRLDRATDMAPQPVQRVTLRPEGGMPMILRRR